MSEKPVYRHSFLNPARTAKDQLKVNRFGHTILGGQLDDNVLPHEAMEVSIDSSGDIVASHKATIFDHPAVQAVILAHSAVKEAIVDQLAAKEAVVDQPAAKEAVVDQPAVKETIFDHPAVKQWALNAGIDPSVLSEEDESQVIEPTDSPDKVPQSLFDRLPDNPSEQMRDSPRLSAAHSIDSMIHPPRLNRSAPQEVQITLPAHLLNPRPVQPVSPPASVLASNSLGRCLGCNGGHPDGARFCPHCGMALHRFCIQCGYQFTGLEKFCPECGTRR
jgi:hypothetical protein